MLARLIRIRYFRLDTGVILQLGQSLLSTPSALRFASLSLPFTNSHCRCWFMSHASHTFTARSPCEGSSATPLLISVFVAVVVVVVTHTHLQTHSSEVPCTGRARQVEWLLEKRDCAHIWRIFGTFFCCCCWCCSCPITNRNFSDTYINWPLRRFSPIIIIITIMSCRYVPPRVKPSNAKTLDWLFGGNSSFFSVVCCCSLTLFVVFWDLFSFFFIGC